MKTNAQLAGVALRLTLGLAIGFIITLILPLPLIDGIGQIAGLWSKSYYTLPTAKFFMALNVDAWVYFEGHGMSARQAVLMMQFVVPFLILLSVFLLFFGIGKFVNRR